jgi:photosystem II stability/assembly factor-like uncharacterized protein
MEKTMKLIMLMMAVLAVAGCTPTPDLSGIARERQKPVQRYDVSQSIASNGKVVVVGTQSGAVLVSIDQGKTWTRNELGHASLLGMTVCGDKGFLAIDYYHKVWSANPEGKNWKSVPLEKPRTPLALTCDPQGGWWVAGVNSVISASADGGQTWHTTNLGEDAQITSIQFVDEKHGIALGEFGLTATTDDGGATWTMGAKIPDDFYPYAALFADRYKGWVSGLAGQILHTVDGGKTWVKQVNAAQATLNRLFIHDGVPFGVGASGVIARLDGDSWRAVPYPDAVPVFLGGGASLPGQSAIVIGGPGGLLRSVSILAKK